MKLMNTKKYILAGLVVLTMGAAFTSCSHDDVYDPSAAKMSVVDTYEKAFVQAFGQPAADQEWGFGTTTSSVRMVTRGISDYVGYKGTMTPQFNFPSDADSSKFLTAVPEGVLSFAEVAGENQTGYAQGVSYLDPSWTQAIDVWGFYDGTNTVGGTLYITGENDFSNRRFGVCQNTDIYLISGATLILRNEDASTMKANIFIAEGATLETAGKLKLDNGAQVYNHGTIMANSFEVNNTSIMYNSGVLDVEGDIFAMNNNSVIVNDGTLTGANLGTQGSGRFLNNAETTIDAETIINSNDNTWVNNGHYVTNNFSYTATSSDVINNCRLTVNNNFCINIADGSGVFKVDGGGSVETRYFYGGGDFVAKDNNGIDVTFQGGPYRVDLGSKSLFKVSETATLNSLGSGTSPMGYGFHGVGEEYAVFQAKNIVKTRDGEGNVAYGGRLYVSAETHFAQGYSGEYPYILYQNGCSESNIYATGFQSGIPSVTIPTTPCNAGFRGGTPPPPPPTGDIRVIAEDLTITNGPGNTDFDFNDVVFDVTWISDNEATITLQAAGGTLPLTVGLADPTDANYLDYEVHEKFGVAVNVMVNTNWRNTPNIDPVSFNITGNFNRDARNIPVFVKKSGEWIELKAEKGIPASKIGVATNYEWCDEREKIEDKYTNFKDWVQDGNPLKWWE